MKKLLLLLVLLPCLLAAQQPKSDWTLYGPSFCYDKGAFIDKKVDVAGIADLIVENDGTFVIASADYPIFFYRDGKEFDTQNFVFTKEGAKVQLIKGGETRDVNTLLIDQSGNLWFGSKKGLHKVEAAKIMDPEKIKEQAMIEGVRFSPETPGLPFSNVKMLKQDKANNIWAVGAKESGIAKIEHKGISKYDGSQWTNYLVTGAEDKEVKALIFDDQNNPIVISQTGLMAATINWYQNGAWKSLGSPGGKSDAASVLAFQNGNLYASTYSDLYKWTADKWEKVALKTTLSHITDMKTDANNLWIASDYGALCINAGGREYGLSSANSPLPGNAVKKIIVDGNDKKWFLTEMGILGFKEPADMSNENRTVYTKFNSTFGDGAINSIVSFKDGLLLSNTDKGLIYFDGKSFTPVTNINEVYYGNIAVDQKGVAYVATKYIHKYDGSTYSRWDWKDDISKQLSAILADSKNNIWIGSGGVSKFDGTTWQNFTKKNAELPSNQVMNLFEDSKGNIWATLYDGISKYDGATWTSFTKKTSGVPLGAMKGIVETKDGKIWFSNGFRLVEYDGTAMKEVAGFKDAGTLRNMILDNDGTLLVATEDKGIVKFKDGVQSACDVLNCTVPTNAIGNIYRDKNGKLWVAFGLPPAVDRFAQMGSAMAGQPAQPATAVENPRDTMKKKIEAFDSPYGFMELRKL